MEKKNKKKELLSEFYQTDLGKKQKPRFKRLMLFSILLIIFSILLVIDGIIIHAGTFQYIASFILLVFGIMFLIGRHRIINNNLIDFIKKRKK